MFHFKMCTSATAILLVTASAMVGKTMTLMTWTGSVVFSKQTTKVRRSLCLMVVTAVRDWIRSAQAAMENGASATTMAFSSVGHQVCS